MKKTTCQYCKRELGKAHEDGCPDGALAAWKRGLKDAVSGMGQAEPESKSYLLGYTNGRAALAEAQLIQRRLNSDSNDY